MVAEEENHIVRLGGTRNLREKVRPSRQPAPKLVRTESHGRWYPDAREERRSTVKKASISVEAGDLLI